MSACTSSTHFRWRRHEPLALQISQIGSSFHLRVSPSSTHNDAPHENVRPRLENKAPFIYTNMETKGHNLFTNMQFIYEYAISITAVNPSELLFLHYFHIYVSYLLQRLYDCTNLCTCTVGPGKHICTF